MNPTASHQRSFLGSHASRLAGSSVAAVLALSILTGLGPVLDQAGLPGAPATVAATGPHIIASALQISRIPKVGAAWRSLKAAADSSAGTPNLSNQDSNNDVMVLAKALVYAKTKLARYRTSVVTNLRAVVGTEAGGRTLAVGRGVAAYVIAADLINLAAYKPSFNKYTFRPWLRRLLTKNLDGDTLVSTNNLRANNWGTHAGAARIAIAIYLGDRLQLARAAKVFHGFVGYRVAYHGFRFGELDWQCHPTRPVGINPKGCIKAGIPVGGVLPDDMRRGGGLQWPPSATNYPWEAMQGLVLSAEMLTRAGYPAWTWSDKALLRAANFLYSKAGWPADSNDSWQPWLLDYRYGTRFRTAAPSHFGKNFGWTDWLYSKRVKGRPRAASAGTVASTASLTGR